MSDSGSSDKQTVPGFQLRFWILGVRPIVWRRLLLSADNTFADLHHAIQITCNWSDEFLHQFKVHGKTIGIRRAHGISHSESADRVTLADMQLRQNERFLYECNYFDNWQLELRVEARGDLETKRSYPLSIAGKRAAPPEDCGGPDRFNQLREHFSPFYIYHRIVECYELYRRRDQLTEDERYDFENRHAALGRFGYWSEVDNFDRRTANRRLQQYATNDESWRVFEETVW